MNSELHNLSQGDLIAFAKGMIDGNNHFSTESWAFPDALKNPLETETANYESLFVAQNLSEGEKQVLMKQKNDHFKNVLIPTLRRVVHFVKATADDPENVLNGYGYDPGDFPTAQGDILALGENFIKGDDHSQGEPWQLTPELRQELDNAVALGNSLFEQCTIAFGTQQETTQTQNESRARLEKILVKCREWLYANVPQARHDEILEIYGLKPLKETGGRIYPPGAFKYDVANKEFSWKKVDAAEKYEVQISTDGGETWKTAAETENTSAQVILPAEKVEAKVRAIKEHSPYEESAWSGVLDIDLRPPAAFDALRKRNLPGGRWRFDWDESARANLYTIAEINSGEEFYEGMLNYCEYEGYSDPGTYRFQVTATNDFGLAKSDILTVVIE